MEEKDSMKTNTKEFGLALSALMILASFSIFAVALASMVVPARAATCTTTLAANDDIQAAINAANPGDVICLSSGTYSPTATIAVNKSVTLQGPQAGVDPRPSECTTRIPGDPSEAIVDGSEAGLTRIFRITASDVILDGLEVRNGSGDMIDSPNNADISGVALRYNIIRDALGDEGIQLRDCANCVIEFNHIFDIAQDGINLCCGSDGGVIQSNEVHDNSSENGAIYIYEATNTTIQCNLIYDVHNKDGIKLGDKGGDDEASTGGSIRYNVVHDTSGDGITVLMSDTLVDGNEVYNSSSSDGAIYVARQVANITIVDNNVHDNTLTGGDAGGITIGTEPDAATITVNNNNIADNSPNGVTNRATAQLDATGNWWNAVNGPGGVGPGSGDDVSTNVDFSGWLTQRAVPQGHNPCPTSDACRRVFVGGVTMPLNGRGLLGLAALVFLVTSAGVLVKRRRD
jgi:parallel beta-helix repeat protein